MSLHQRHIFYDMNMLGYFIKQIGQDHLQKFSEPYILGELRETSYVPIFMYFKCYYLAWYYVVGPRTFI